MGRARVVLALGGALAISGGGALSLARADGGFVEAVTVLHVFHSADQPASRFGWAVSELQDVNGDGATDVIVGEPFRQPRFHGRLYVYSGATGDLLFQERGKPGDTLGWAIADGGDENGDGVHDVVGGAP